MRSKPQARHRIHQVVDQSELLAYFGYNLRRASLRLAQQYIKPMKQLGLRPAEFAALLLLRVNRGVSQKSLARALAMNAPNMATLLDRLEENGLVRRLRHPGDERARQLELTAAGRRLVARAAVAVDQHERRAIVPLTTAEQAELMRLLGKLIASEVSPG